MQSDACFQLTLALAPLPAVVIFDGGRHDCGNGRHSGDTALRARFIVMEICREGRTGRVQDASQRQTTTELHTEATQRATLLCSEEAGLRHGSTSCNKARTLDR